jgi:hypothetical protein
VKEQHASVPLRRSRSFECLVRSFSTNSRPALRAASGRPPARRRHDGHRGTGLTLQPRGSQSRHERPVGAHLGHAPTDSSGQPRSTTDPSACRFTCADAVDQHPARNHTVYGMQGVRGSNPLSSTPGQRPSPSSTARQSPASGSKLAAIWPGRPIQRPVGRCCRPALLALSRGRPGLTRAGGLGRARRRIGSAGHGKSDHRLAS